MHNDHRKNILEELRATLAQTSQQTFSAEEVMSLVHTSLQQISTRSESEEVAWMERLSALYDTTNAILAETELKVLLELIVQRAVSLSGTAKGMLLLLDTGNETIIEVVSVGISKSQTENMTYQEVSEGISGWVIRNKQRTLSNNLLTDPRNTGLALERAKSEVVRSQSCVIVPLMIGEEILGTLTVVHNAGNERLDVIDLELISHLAGQAAVAIQNARLVDVTRLQLRYAKALRSIDSALNASLDLHVFFNVLLTHLTIQLSVDAADVLIYNQGLQILTYYSGMGFRTREHHPTRLRVGRGYAGQVIMARKPLKILNLPEAKEDGHFRLLDEEGFQAYYGWPLIARGEICGVLEVFHRAPINPDTEWMNFFKSVAESAAIAIADAKLLEDLQRTNDEMILAYDATLEGWVQALDAWGPREEEHIRRVTEVVLQLAQEMGISGKTLHDLRRGTLLHAIGRMGIDPDRWARHVEGNYADKEIHRDMANNAYQILRPIEYLGGAMEIPYAFCEHWDGSGMPRGIQGEKIPLLARLVSVVHTWDTLQITSNQQDPLTRAQATAFLKDQAGKRFDPAVVDVFTNMLDRGLPGEHI